MLITIRKKLLAIIALTLVIVAVILGGVGAFLVTTLDQATIKEKLSHLVYAKTGRELTINGEVKWMIFPWLGIKIHNVTLSNHPEFKDSYFTTAKEISISLKLLPLLWKRLEIGYLTLKEFNLQLTRNAAGKTNWQDLLAADHSLPSTPTQPKYHLANLTIDTITLNKGTILWQDQQAKRQFTISNFSLHCKAISLARPFAATLSFSLNNLTSWLGGEVTLNTQIAFDNKQQLLAVNSLHLLGKLTNKTTQKLYDLQGQAEMKFDLSTQALVAATFKLNAAGLVALGALHGAPTTTNANWSGNFTISNTDSETWTQFLGVQPYLKKGSSTKLKIVGVILPKRLKLPTIELHYNDMKLQGNAEYIADKIAFSIVANKLDTALFTQPIAKPPKPTPPPTTTTPPTSQALSKLLQTTKLQGEIKIGAIKVKQLLCTNFMTKVISNNEVINCPNFKFDFYQGQATGSAKFDSRKALFLLNLALQNTALHPLLIDLAQYPKFRGTLNLAANIDLNNLNGNGNLLITQGSYQGIDIPHEVRRAHAIINNKPLPLVASTNHTGFNQLTLNFQMTQGLLRTNDLLIQAPDYKVTGQGTANLLAKNLNLALSASSPHDEHFFIPIKISGAITNPTIRFDAAVMLQHTVKKVIKDLLQEQLEKQLPIIPKDLKNILPLDKLIP